MQSTTPSGSAITQAPVLMWRSLTPLPGCTKLARRSVNCEFQNTPDPGCRIWAELPHQLPLDRDGLFSRPDAMGDPQVGLGDTENLIRLAWYRAKESPALGAHTAPSSFKTALFASPSRAWAATHISTTSSVTDEIPSRALFVPGLT
jgi:hypothetical protein